MDIVDQADGQIQAQLAASIQNAARAKPGPVATGFCLNPKCNESLPAGRRFCDADCRDSWERRCAR